MGGPTVRRGGRGDGMGPLEAPGGKAQGEGSSPEGQRAASMAEERSHAARKSQLSGHATCTWA
jgi:hypothetical protein